MVRYWTSYYWYNVSSDLHTHCIYCSDAQLHNVTLSSKSGRFIKGGELNQRKSCAEKFRVVSQQCSEGEKAPANTMFEREVSWDDGRRVEEMGMLAEGLKSCCFCQQPIQLKNVVDEKRYGLASLLYIQCSCGQINTVRTGKITDVLTHVAECRFMMSIQN